MAESPTLVMTMPATLRYRDVAVRWVTACCRLVGNEDGEAAKQDPQKLDLQRDFDSEFISAFSEIFNNIAIHAYAGAEGGTLTLEITPAADFLRLAISDVGEPFDLSSVPTPELDSLPEGGMGIHIARACVDDLTYSPGPPNIWRLTKYLSHASEQ